MAEVGVFRQRQARGAVFIFAAAAAVVVVFFVFFTVGPLGGGDGGGGRDVGHGGRRRRRQDDLFLVRGRRVPRDRGGVPRRLGAADSAPGAGDGGGRRLLRGALRPRRAHPRRRLLGRHGLDTDGRVRARGTVGDVGVSERQAGGRGRRRWEREIRGRWFRRKRRQRRRRLGREGAERAEGPGVAVGQAGAAGGRPVHGRVRAARRRAGAAPAPPAGAVAAGPRRRLCFHGLEELPRVGGVGGGARFCGRGGFVAARPLAAAVIIVVVGFAGFGDLSALARQQQQRRRRRHQRCREVVGTPARPARGRRANLRQSPTARLWGEVYHADDTGGLCRFESRRAGRCCRGVPRRRVGRRGRVDRRYDGGKARLPGTGKQDHPPASEQRQRPLLCRDYAQGEKGGPAAATATLDGNGDREARPG